MTKVLLTGMSGVGKSTILNQLNRDDTLTIDLDYDEWISFDDNIEDYVMDSKRIIDFIKHNNDKDIFFAGTTVNQKEIYPYLDFVIALTAPLEVIKERLQNRKNNNFGKSKEDWSKIVNDTVKFESLIIQSSDLTISTDKPVNDVISEIYNLVGFR